MESGSGEGYVHEGISVHEVRVREISLTSCCYSQWKGWTVHVINRIGNTDAEGRMAMVDVLCKCKE